MDQSYQRQISQTPSQDRYNQTTPRIHPPSHINHAPPLQPAPAGRGQIDLGLDRMVRLMKCLPVLKVPTIHLAGTNGKGSVSAMLEACLVASDLRVGRYNSPHLIEPRDGIRINGRPPHPEHYRMAFETVQRKNQQFGIGATSFELSTATAFHLLNTALPSLDVMIIECGMGGAKDATNIIENDLQLAAGLTSVGLDHTSFLGNTISEIATDKAKIAKEGSLFYIGPQKYPEAGDTASKVALNLSSRVRRATSSIRLNGRLVKTTCVSDAGQTTFQTHLPLPGEHQLENVGLTLSILHGIRTDRRATFIQSKLTQITDSSIVSGIEKTRWEGRCSWIPYTSLSLISPIATSLSTSSSLLTSSSIPTSTSSSPPLHISSPANLGNAILVDGAHNTDSAQALRKYLDSIHSQNITFIIALSSSRDKTINSVLSPLLRKGDTVISTTFSPVENMSWVRSVPPEELSTVARELVDNVEICKDVKESIQVAIHKLKMEGKGLIVVCGSLYLVADVYRLCPPSDWITGEFVRTRDASKLLEV
ncbi:hypothetical protein TREMEDRAFT_31421 [Tremella mesenterica DSM 1558]|uniref:uncharacterized protein n=1 Tax=Tremella mesenterica (strain ATCC 24925 / CBS 8224 / DSM 1558 / NBRC 9311 / NRRL Y-6157 / RJB 2259-6 / UBC 559-6) TaxID=578456 RepID=UPI0003F48F12|nr:uncharacterized protein TREMEDRAFT_31421 [Tremella mesenterica DSM 1558]EIW69102.1 hypothetical protein TREMEDRAFT_31421 [Tremella mesenterica DSM 1558]